MQWKAIAFGRRFLAAALVIVAAAWGSGARAALVSYNFTAQLLNAPFPGVDSSTGSFVGSFVLDTTVAAQPNGGAPLLNAAEFSGAIQSLSVSILNNTYTASSADLFVHHQFLGVNEDTYFIDTKTISGPTFSGAGGKPYSPSEIGIELIQSAGTLFSDASILPVVTLSDNGKTNRIQATSSI